MGRRKKSEYMRSYNLTWTNAVCRQYAETVAYRKERKAREYRHMPFAWEDPVDDDSTSQSTEEPKENGYDDQVGVAQLLHEDDAAAESERDEPKSEEDKDEEPPPENAVARKEKKLTKRKTRKIPKLNEKGPFHAYGWGNESRAGGRSDRRTFNVRVADGREIHPTALRAMKRRQLDEQMREELRKRRSLEQKRLQGAFNLGPAGRDDDDDVWLTEYQRNYSGHSRR